jgi:hypothetical protein
MESNKTRASNLESHLESNTRKFVNEKRLKRGHTLYRFNFNNGVLEEAVISPEVRIKTTPFPTMPNLKKGQRQIMTGPLETETRRRSVIFEVGSYYFGALNMSNAQRHLRKFLPNIQFSKYEEERALETISGTDNPTTQGDESL